jgi:short-subunit dehydrogenase
MKVVLITGATGGLGLELAKLYQHEKLILIGRQPKPESELFQKHLYIQCELSQPDAAHYIVSALQQENIQHLDLLIHNAALGYYGHVVNQSKQNLSDLLQVNLYTPVALTHALAKHLHSGKVVFINSIAAHMAAPDYAVYAASKAALRGFATNLRIENKIRVQTIYPGAIQTTFHNKNGVPVGQFKVEKFPEASKVAQDIYKAIQTHKPDVTIGFVNKIAGAAAYYFPRLFDSFVRSKT